MSKISEHTRRVKTGKLVKIRPHERERNRIIDPGEKYVKLSDPNIVLSHLIKYLSNTQNPVSEFSEAILTRIMKRTIGFLEAEELYNSYTEEPKLSISFYVTKIDSETIETIIELAEIARVIESEQAVNEFTVKEIKEFYLHSTLQQLNSTIEATTDSQKTKSIKMVLEQSKNQ